MSTASPSGTPPAQKPASQHYENFPVASLLCPPRLRPAITAIYWFARTADDIADEGDARPAQRLRDLAAIREEKNALHGEIAHLQNEMKKVSAGSNRIGELRHDFRIGVRGCLHAFEADRREALDQRALHRGGYEIGLVLQTVAREALAQGDVGH